MARKNTLTDLSDYLAQNPLEIETGKTTTKEEFIKKKPNSIVEVPQGNQKEFTASHLDGASISEIANYLHKEAKKQGISFTELWLQIIEEGAKIDPLLKNTSVLKTIKSINKTSLNVVLEGIGQLIKNKK